MIGTRKFSKFIKGAAIVAAGLLGLSPGAAAAVAGKDTPAGYGKLPLVFEPNEGQIDARVKFLSRGPGYTLFLTESEAVLSLRGTEGKGHALRVKLLGARPDAITAGLARLPGVSNYFIGRDRSKWRTGVPHYAKVGYEGVYPGIDLVFYGTSQRRLEYDFVVAPGADPSRITLGFEGAERLEIDESGDLVVHLAGGEVRFLKPVIYQQEDGAKQPVEGGYALKDGRVTFDLAAYDPAKRLVIDPVLEYATYLGGTDIEEFVRSIAVDGFGNAHIAGRTRSSDFPIVGGIQDTCVITEGFSDCHDAFVAKLDATGSNLLYSTYLGGPGFDTAFGIAAGPMGNMYVTGIAGAEFPTTELAYEKFSGSGFFAKFDPDGRLLYSTYLDSANASDIAVNSMGRAVIVGYTTSGNFPTTPGAFQPECKPDPSSCSQSAFVTIIDPDDEDEFPDNDLVYSTFLGGSAKEYGFGVAVDDAGLVYVTGSTYSDDFPTSDGAFQVEKNLFNSAFVTVINPAGNGASDLVYSSYLQGVDGQTLGSDVAVKPGCTSPCIAYLTGGTSADDFPTTADAIAPFPVTGFGTFVTLIDPATGTLDPTDDLVYSTYFDTPGLSNFAVDADGIVYLAGRSGAVPTRDAIQAENAGRGDAFIAVIDPKRIGLDGLKGLDGGLLFATNLGGTSDDTATAIAVGGSGTEVDPIAAYVTGLTYSLDFPTNEDAFQTEISEPKKRGKPSTSASAPDAFIAKIVGPFEGKEQVEALDFRLVATADSYALDEDVVLSVDAPGVIENDADFPSGTVISNTNPGNGAVEVNADGSFIYTPNADFSGTDSFIYFVSDGESTDGTVVRLDVAPFPDPPIANDDRYFTVTSQTLMVSPSDGVLANDSDPDGDPFTVSGNSSPDNGTVVLNSDGSFIYTPGSFSGTASFTYQASDGPDVTDVSDPATVMIDVSDGSLHVGDLDGSSSVRNRTSWRARVDVGIDDKNHDPLGDVRVTFAWEISSGGTGTAWCMTSASSGHCIVALSVFKKVTSVTFTVTDVTHAALTYKAVDNHDPDGDSVIASDGTISITVTKP